MFRFRKIAQDIKTSVKEAVTFEHEDVHEVIERIHSEFDTAADKALLEAKEILAKSSEFNLEKMELLKKAGFVANKTLEKAEIEAREKNDAKYRADIVLKWSEKYPNNKFIFLDQVNNICSKYGLVCGSVNRYIGEVPYKNLLEINNFKPNEEDIFFIEDYRSSSIYSSPKRDALDPYASIVNSSYRKDTRASETSYSMGNYSYTSIPFYICAPVKDMKFDQHERKGNFLVKEYPDPIVMHFVKDGFLIVSKWGIEADDDMLK